MNKIKNILIICIIAITCFNAKVFAYEIEEDQVIAGLVSNNFGIAIVPYMPILKFMNVKTIDISSPTWERNFYLALLKDKTLTPIAENFKSFVIDNYTL